MAKLQWPERPTHHGETARFSGSPIEWQQRGTCRHCSYCGSVHPEDLLRLIAEGARLGGSDWKYGYPHKFYIHDCPDRDANKFYTDHLRDEGYSDEAFAALVTMLEAQTGIEFVRDADGTVQYSSPYYGYQR